MVASANPNVDFMAAWALYRRHRVPYVMDYRDAWLLDVFSGGTLHPDGSRAARLEQLLVEHAREVWFVNEPIRRWHQARYPAAAARMHVVANGFDPELVPPPRVGPSDPVRGVTFGYLGTLSRRVPLAELIAGWRWAREHDDLAARSRVLIHGYLGYYATPQADLLELVNSAVDADFRYAGPVAKGGIANAYASFDVLLLAIGAGRYVTSGKVFEYMATGMPIVSVHDAGNAASDVLRGYPLWFPVADLTADAVGNALVRCGPRGLRRGRGNADCSTRVCRCVRQGSPAAPAGRGTDREVDARPGEARADTGGFTHPRRAQRADVRITCCEASRSATRAVDASGRCDEPGCRPRRAHADVTGAPGRDPPDPASGERGDVALDLWSWAPVEPMDPTGPHPVTARVLGPSTAWSTRGDPPPSSGATRHVTSQRLPSSVTSGRGASPPSVASRLPPRGASGQPPGEGSTEARPRRRRPPVCSAGPAGWRLLAAAERCDVVVALDPAATLAAWRIARRVVRPDVVLGLPATERALRSRVAGPGPVVHPTPTQPD